MRLIERRVPAKTLSRRVFISRDYHRFSYNRSLVREKKLRRGTNSAVAREKAIREFSKFLSPTAHALYYNA